MILSRNLGWALFIYLLTCFLPPLFPLNPSSSFPHQLIVLSFSVLLPLSTKEKNNSPLDCRLSSELSSQQGEERWSPAVQHARLHAQLLATHWHHAQKCAMGLQCSCPGSSWGLNGDGFVGEITRNHGQREGDGLDGHVCFLRNVAGCILWFWVMQFSLLYYSVYMYTYTYIYMYVHTYVCLYILTYSLIWKIKLIQNGEKQLLYLGDIWKCAQTLVLGTWEVKKKEEECNTKWQVGSLKTGKNHLGSTPAGRERAASPLLLRGTGWDLRTGRCNAWDKLAGTDKAH